MKLKSILLVDDNRADNRLHQRAIRKAGAAENVLVAKSGIQALEILQSEDKDKYPTPDLIFLDINMHPMNGWQFIEEFKKLRETLKKKTVIIIMLSTSLNPDDHQKVEDEPLISAFEDKPLTVDGLNAILTKYSKEFKTQ